MKRAVIGAAVFVAALAAARRFGPALAQRGMNKCHQMMGKSRKCSASKPALRPAHPA